MWKFHFFFCSACCDVNHPKLIKWGKGVAECNTRCSNNDDLFFKFLIYPTVLRNCVHFLLVFKWLQNAVPQGYRQYISRKFLVLLFRHILTDNKTDTFWPHCWFPKLPVWRPVINVEGKKKAQSFIALIYPMLQTHKRFKGQNKTENKTKQTNKQTKKTTTKHLFWQNFRGNSYFQAINQHLNSS